MERNVITGIAHDQNEAMVTLTGIGRRAGHARRDLRAARRGQHQRRHDRAERPRGRRPPQPQPDLHRPDRGARPCVAELEKGKDQIGFDEILTNTEVVKVSAVGVGMRSNAGIAAKMFETLADAGHQHPRHHAPPRSRSRC